MNITTFNPQFAKSVCKVTSFQWIEQVFSKKNIEKDTNACMYEGNFLHLQNKVFNTKHNL